MQRLTMRCWAEVSLDNLAHNFQVLKAGIPETCRVMGVIKANGYGHGAVSIGRELKHMGVDYLGVACLHEAIELRNDDMLKEIPILILGYTDSCFAEDLYLHGLTQTVYDYESAAELSAWATERNATLAVHIKVDTGMSRLGLLCAENQGTVMKEIQRMVALPNLCFEGIFTHLASADGDEEYTLMQLGRFFSLLEQLAQVGIHFAFRHCESSAAVINYSWAHRDGKAIISVPEGLHMNMVRTGITLFGHGSDASVNPLSLGLRPVMKLFARVAQVTEFPAGTRISYGGIHTLDKPRRVATLSIGYADGYSRSLSDRHYVMLRGQPAPILGRICMDMCMVDVSDIPDIKKGDAAEIFGDQLPLAISAKTMETIPYEILCAVSPRVARVYK